MSSLSFTSITAHIRYLDAASGCSCGSLELTSPKKGSEIAQSRSGRSSLALDGAQNTPEPAHDSTSNRLWHQVVMTMAICVVINRQWWGLGARWKPRLLSQT
jgi:hypothetical protein